MKNEKHEQFIKTILATILASYPNFVINPLSQGVWLAGLKGCRVSDVQKALAEHIRKSQFAPTIADIRTLCMSYQKRRDGAKSLVKINDYQIAYNERKLIGGVK